MPILTLNFLKVNCNPGVNYLRPGILTTVISNCPNLPIYLKVKQATLAGAGHAPIPNVPCTALREQLRELLFFSK